MRLTTRGQATAQAIALRVPFTTGGALYAEAGTRYVNPGHLPRECEDRLQGADYVVYSYATPIAWHTADGWIVPAVRYSITTSRHQGNLYMIPNDEIVSRPNPSPDRYGMTRQPSSTGGAWS